MDSATALRCGMFDGLRFLMLAIMMGTIRFLACRLCTLVDIRLAHISVADDSDSPLQAVLRFFLPKHKADRLGSNGGAAMRAYPNFYNQYLDPTLAITLWLLLMRPYIEQAVDAECKRIRVAAEAQVAAKGGKMPSDDAIYKKALNNIYLFPRLSGSGTPDFTKPVETAVASSILKLIKEAAGFAARAFTFHGVVSVFNMLPAPAPASLNSSGNVLVQGRHALFYVAASVGMTPLEMQAWARWYAESDARGYMKNDEAFLARLSRLQVS